MHQKKQIEANLLLYLINQCNYLIPHRKVGVGYSYGIPKEILVKEYKKLHETNTNNPRGSDR
jgi:hypothetical protein